MKLCLFIQLLHFYSLGMCTIVLRNSTLVLYAKIDGKLWPLSGYLEQNRGSGEQVYVLAWGDQSPEPAKFRLDINYVVSKDPIFKKEHSKASNSNSNSNSQSSGDSTSDSIRLNDVIGYNSKGYENSRALLGAHENKLSYGLSIPESRFYFDGDMRIINHQFKSCALVPGLINYILVGNMEQEVACVPADIYLLPYEKEDGHGRWKIVRYSEADQGGSSGHRCRFHFFGDRATKDFDEFLHDYKGECDVCLNTRNQHTTDEL